ncbi:transposase family protein [Snodgrassella alvi]|uniref:transposase family protein n=1 Tax=Snodgrassella alvi TaxID=1196083 RepID=UPI001C556C3C|nr:transposase family protein [Snodgrassella alvi]
MQLVYRLVGLPIIWDKLAGYHGYPLKIRVDNKPEFTGKIFIDWAKSHGKP